MEINTNIVSKLIITLITDVDLAQFKFIKNVSKIKPDDPNCDLHCGSSCAGVNAGSK